MLLHLSDNAMQLTTFCWLLGGVLIVPFMGPFSERFGRKPTLLAGVAAIIFGSVIVMLSHGLILFLVGRFCQGMAVAPMLIAGYAAINEFFCETQAIRWMARISALSVLSPGLGPAFGGAWIAHFSWQSLFGLLAILGFFNGILLFYYMPETASNKQLSSLQAGRALHGYIALFSNRYFMLNLCKTFIPRFGFVAWVLASVFILVDVYHIGTVTYGWLLGATFSCIVIGNLIVNYFSRPTRNEFLLSFARVCILLGAIISMIIAWWAPHHLVVLLCALGVFSIGVGINEPIMIRVSLSAHNEQMGLRTTVLSFVRMTVDSAAALTMMLFYNGSAKSIVACLLLSAGIMLLLLFLQKKTIVEACHK